MSERSFSAPSAIPGRLFAGVAAFIALGATGSPAQAARPALCKAATHDGYFFADGVLLQRKAFARASRRIPEKEAMDGLKAFLAELDARGIEVAILLWPNRPIALDLAMPSNLQWDREAEIADYHRLRTELSDLAHVPDLLGPLSEGGVENYFLYDHHLTPRGLDRMAEVVATLSLPDLPEQAYKREEGASKIAGASMGEAVAKLCDTPPLKQKVPQALIEPAGLGLLDAAVEPVVTLVGTSQSNEKFALATRLAHVRSTPVQSFHVNGGGAMSGLTAYVHSDNFHDKTPRVMIWEIPWQSLGMRSGDARPDIAEPSLYEQLLPALDGPCGDHATARYEVELSASKPSESLLVKDGRYLHAQLDAPQPDTIEITFDTSARRTWDSWSKVTGIRHRYQLIPDGAAAVTLTTTATDPVKLVVSACPAPTPQGEGTEPQP